MLAAKCKRLQMPCLQQIAGSTFILILSLGLYFASATIARVLESRGTSLTSTTLGCPDGNFARPELHGRAVKNKNTVRSEQSRAHYIRSPVAGLRGGDLRCIMLVGGVSAMQLCCAFADSGAAQTSGDWNGNCVVVACGVGIGIGVRWLRVPGGALNCTTGGWLYCVWACSSGMGFSNSAGAQGDSTGWGFGRATNDRMAGDLAPLPNFWGHVGSWYCC